jgi:hypothetical protein
LAGLAVAGLSGVCFAVPAWAQEASALDSGDTAWMLTSTALVLMMTIPGVALFYGGMVRKKNVLGTVMQSFAVTCLVTVLWMVIGYSLAFSAGTSFVGGLDRLFLNGLAVESMTGTIPESVFMVFQMTFAIITPALITGAIAERMKFSALLWFIGLWSVIVYAPIAYWVWGGGFLFDAGVLDFAGGTVVHINSGVAALVAAMVLGKRIGYGRENLAPHNLTLTVIGAALLWGRLGGGRQRQRRHGHGGDPDRLRGRSPGLDVRRVDDPQEAQRVGHRLGRDRRPGGDHAGLGLRRPGRRPGDRADRRPGLLLGRDLAQAQAGLRRFPGRLRRARPGRHRRRGPDRRLRGRGDRRHAGPAGG